MPELKDYLNDLNIGKENLLRHPVDWEINRAQYKPFVVNHCLHPFMDSILQVNEMNVRPYTPKVMQYDYLTQVLWQRKRFAPWLKQKKVQDLDLVKRHYNVSDAKAKEYLQILTKEDLAEIKRKYETGGKK